MYEQPISADDGVLSETHVTVENVEGLVLRFATVDDVGELAVMVCELQQSKGAAIADGVSEQQLRSSLFEAPRRDADVVLAVHQNHIVGFALITQNFSTCLGKAGIVIQDLFI